MGLLRRIVTRRPPTMFLRARPHRDVVPGCPVGHSWMLPRPQAQADILRCPGTVRPDILDDV